eukprot:16440858-Heterocapsa_arctica.AAC.1
MPTAAAAAAAAAGPATRVWPFGPCPWTVLQQAHTDPSRPESKQSKLHEQHSKTQPSKDSQERPSVALDGATRNETAAAR